MQALIEKRLNETMKVHHLRVDNDSHLHAGDRTDSHFKVLLVSEDFNDLSAVKRHQKVYGILSDVLKNIHALQLTTWTLKEWQEHTDKDIPSSRCQH